MPRFNGSSIGARLSGILSIDGERIEYYQKQGNTIKQLRRGTFGTGIPTVPGAANQIFDQSRHPERSYKDEFPLRTTRVQMCRK